MDTKQSPHRTFSGGLVRLRDAMNAQLHRPLRRSSGDASQQVHGEIGVVFGSRCQFCINFPWNKLDRQTFQKIELGTIHEEARLYSEFYNSAQTCELCVDLFQSLEEEYRKITGVAFLKPQREPDKQLRVMFRIYVSHHLTKSFPMLIVKFAKVDTSRPEGGFIMVESYYRKDESSESALHGNSRPQSSGDECTRPVSYAELRSWDEACGHATDCLIAPSEDSPETCIRLIDVEERCITDLPITTSFLALSYVWGTGASVGEILQEDNTKRLYCRGSISDHADIPPTIADAMKVTSELGYRYLYVDRMCIVQDNKEDQSFYVDSMHEIFRRAKITIIAAAGDSPWLGLPGVSRTPRSAAAPCKRLHVSVQENFRLLRVYKSEWRPAAIIEKALSLSTWATRAWTLQEKLLSRRLLIFTKDLVYWQCPHMYTYENAPFRPGELKANYVTDFGRTLDLRLDSIKRPTSEQISIHYMSFVEQYMRRQLTYEDDVERAFKGITSALEKIFSPWPFHHSISASTFAMELQWHCACCFGDARNDCHMTLRRATNKYPSWSWLAWKGHICYIKERHSPARLALSFRPKNPVYEELETDDIVPVVYKADPDAHFERIHVHEESLESAADPIPAVTFLWLSRHPECEKALVFPTFTRNLPLGLLDRSSSFFQIDLQVPFPKTKNVPFSVMDETEMRCRWLHIPQEEIDDEEFGLVSIGTAPVQDFDQDANIFLFVAWKTTVGVGMTEGEQNITVGYRRGMLACRSLKASAVRKKFKWETVVLC